MATPKDSLKLTRFCGEELYPIEKATWHFYNDGEGENELWLEIAAGAGTQLSEDTKTLGARPGWELTFRVGWFTKKELEVGLQMELESGYDDAEEDAVTNFYYCEHEQTDNNVFEILEQDGNRFRIRLTGEVTDVNYYDGSKPVNIIAVETWFTEV